MELHTEVPNAQTCPACKKPREVHADECPFCGVIYARWRPPAATRVHRSSIGEPTPQRGSNAATGRIPLRPRAERAWLLVGLAQWLQVHSDPHPFWTSALVQGLPRRIRDRLARAAARSSDPIEVLMVTGYLTASAAVAARQTEAANRLAPGLRLIATAERARQELRTSWITSISLPLLATGALLLVGEVPFLVATTVAPSAFLPAMALIAAGVALWVWAAQSRTDERGLDQVLKKAIGILPSFGHAYRWRAQQAALEVIDLARVAALPADATLKIAALAGDHPALEAIAAGSTQHPVLAIAGWLRARDRASLTYAVELDRVANQSAAPNRLHEIIEPIRVSRQRAAARLERISAWAIVLLIISASTIAAVIRVAYSWMQYTQDLGL